MITIKTYRAIDEPQLSKEYLKGHIQVLKDYGIENITSNNNEWVYNSNIYCITAHNQNEMIGGIRIQKKDKNISLPVELAIGDIDQKIYEIINNYYHNGGIGELCGLWNSNKVKKIGVSMVLIRAAISIINQLDFKTLTGICAEYSLRMFQQVGFKTDETIGNQGKLIYPNEKYIAQVVGILNSVKLESALPFDRNIMLSLREQPIQYRNEFGPKGNFDVDYNLVLNAKSKVC